MKKVLLIFFGVVALLTLFFLLNPRFAAKRGALGSASQTLLTADHHHALVAEGGWRALGADHNLAVITRANRYIATFGSGTSVYREIVRIAAEADQECEKLEAVLDLAVRSTSDADRTHYGDMLVRTMKEYDVPHPWADRILALAESACAVDGQEEEAAWQEVFDVMDVWAAYPTVEVAEEKQKGL